MLNKVCGDCKCFSQDGLGSGGNCLSGAESVLEKEGYPEFTLRVSSTTKCKACPDYEPSVEALSEWEAACEAEAEEQARRLWAWASEHVQRAAA